MVMAHKACKLEYTSSYQIGRYLKRKSNDKQEEVVRSKRNRRSNASVGFEKNYRFCANSCSTDPDPKHAGRQRKNKGMLRQTANRGKGKKLVKQVLIVVNYFLLM